MGCPTITGFPIMLGCGCPNIQNVDNNGNPCPQNCTNGCMDGTTGLDCNGKPSPYC